MLKRINWKSVFKCFAWIVSLAGITVLMSFIDAKKKTVLCTKVKILIPGADNFIEREEIDAILKQSNGSLVGQNLTSINLQRIEKSIIANPYIAYATVYADMNGEVQISVKQRQPVLRVINAAGQDYYIDSNGLKMPVSPNFTANVLAANGNIMEHFSGKVDTLITKLAIDLYKVALYVKKDTLWDAQIEQLFVNNTKDIEMTPRLGNQRIILGTADSLETKMRNLRVFYKKAMPKVGWNTYKTINVKYVNQIVCEKNKIDSVTGEVIKEYTPANTKKENKVIDSIVRREIAREVEKGKLSTQEETRKVTAADERMAVNNKKEKVKTDTKKNN